MLWRCRRLTFGDGRILRHAGEVRATDSPSVRRLSLRALRPGLRARIVAYFSLATFVGVVILSVVTFTATRSYLVETATTSARAQALSNAQLIGSLVGSSRDLAGEVVTSLRTEAGGFAVLHLGAENLFYAQAPLRFTQSNLPTAMPLLVSAGCNGCRSTADHSKPSPFPYRQSTQRILRYSPLAMLPTRSARFAQRSSRPYW
jgi:hypothetical protein